MYSVIQKQKDYCKAGDFIYKNKDTIYPILSFAASCDPVLNKLSGRLIKLREEEESKDFFVSFLIPMDKRLKSLSAIELSCDTHVKTRH